jgi:hypothetical protein
MDALLGVNNPNICTNGTQSFDDPVLKGARFFTGSFQFHEYHSPAGDNHNAIRYPRKRRGYPFKGQSTRHPCPVSEVLLQVSLKHTKLLFGDKMTR